MSEPDSQSAAGGGLSTRPWRSFLGCLLVVTLALLVRRDLGLGGPETLADSVPDASVAFMARIAMDPFRLGLFALVLAACLYAIIQHAALSADLRAARNPGSRFSAGGRVIRFISGRGAATEPQLHLDAVAAWAGDDLLEPLHLGVAAFPMIGFLGTVIGLSGAIEALPSAIGDETMLSGVLGDLHVAFDTTLLGLAGALVCLLGGRLGESRVDRIQRFLS